MQKGRSRLKGPVQEILPFPAMHRNRLTMHVIPSREGGRLPGVALAKVGGTSHAGACHTKAALPHPLLPIVRQSGDPLPRL
jgi:hypothetical protein